MMFRHSKRLRLGSHREVTLHRMIGRNRHDDITQTVFICLDSKIGNDIAIVSAFKCHVILRPVTWTTFQVEANCFRYICASEDR